MRTFIRAALASFMALAFFVGPVSAATTQAITVAQAAQTGTITGQVTSDSGAAVSGAQVLIEGSGQRVSATTDDSGAFSATLPAGLYTVTVVKGGYQTGSNDVTVAAGTSTDVSVVMTAASLNNLGVIGRTTSSSTISGTRFNISSTAQQTLTGAQILDRNTPDLTEVLNELPGVTIPHATSNPNEGFVIRGMRYETKTQIDGHPISSGTLGMFVSNYASSAIFSSVDVVKGAGLNGPTAAESAAGTVNLHTPDFAKNGAFVSVGMDNYGGTLYNALATVNFLKDDRLSFVFGRTFSGNRGPTYGLNEPDYTGATPAIGTFTVPSLMNGVVQYDTDFSDTYSLNAELAKVRYKFSDATSLSAEFLGLQGRFDPQGGAYGQFVGNLTVPQCLNANKAASGAACTATSEYNNPAFANQIGSVIPIYAYFPGSDVRQNQPTFSADFKTTLGNDTILLRPYTAAINRLIDGTQENTVPGDNGGGWSEVTNAANCQVNYVAPTGPGGASGPCFAAGINPSNVPAFVNDPNTPHVFAATNTPITCTVAAPCYTTSTGINNMDQVGYGTPFTTLEIDHLFGYTFSYIHPVGANTYNVSYDHYYDDTTDLINDASPLAPGCTFVIGPAPANTPGALGSQPTCVNPVTGTLFPTLRVTPLSVPETFASVGSLAATAQLALTPKLEFDAGAYFTSYLINGQQENPAVYNGLLATYGPAGRTAAIPVVLSGVQNSASHFDPHFGFVFRPNRDLVFRFTGGSSMSIPYASLVSGFVTYSQGSTSTTVSTPNYYLLPEEIVTLDLGSDWRTPDGTILSGDIYNMVTHNPWLTTKVLLCNCSLPGLEPTQQTFQSQTLNGAQEYSQGIEFSVTREPLVGFGYRVNTAFERQYYLDTPAAFFASPETFVNGEQYVSNGSGFTSVPYAKGYAEIEQTFENKSQIRLGAEYEGSNNSYNAPAFWVFDAGFKANLGWHDVIFGAALENLTNLNWNAQLAKGLEYQGLAPVAGASAPGGYAYSTPFNTAEVSPGPFTVRFTLSKQF